MFIYTPTIYLVLAIATMFTVLFVFLLIIVLKKKIALIIIIIAIICTIIVVIIDNIIIDTYRLIREHNINFNITICTAYDNNIHYAPV